MAAPALFAMLFAGTAPARADTLGLPPAQEFLWQESVKLSKLPQENAHLARNRREWRALWKQLRGAKAVAPQLDFHRVMVVGVVAKRDQTVSIYRIAVEGSDSSPELVVHTTPGARQPARIHLVATPQSLLPIRFVVDTMVDGRIALGGHGEGFDSATLATIKARARPASAAVAAYREDAETRVRKSLTAAQIAQARSELPVSYGKRYPEPWSEVEVRREPKAWRIIYDGMSFRVDVASGDLSKE
jgi:hypothetical protein